MAHISTIKLLIAWAKWGEAQSIGYPSMSPMFGERALKTPLYGIGHLPDDVFLVECAVCRLEWDDRDALIARYQRHLTWSQMGQRIGISGHRARRRLLQAEDRVEQNLKNTSFRAKESVKTLKTRKLSEDPAHAGFLHLRG